MSRGVGASRREGTREGDVEKELRRGWGVERVMGKDEEKRKNNQKSPDGLGCPFPATLIRAKIPKHPFRVTLNALLGVFDSGV